MELYKLSYEWENEKDGPVHCVFLGIFSKRKYAKEALEKIKEKKYCDGKNGSFYILRVDINRKVNTWYGGFDILNNQNTKGKIREFVEVVYEWEDAKDGDMIHSVSIGVFSKKKYAKKAVEKMKQKGYVKGKRGKFYFFKIRLNQKINGWYGGYFSWSEEYPEGEIIV